MSSQHSARPIPLRKPAPQTSGPPLFLPIRQNVQVQQIYVDEDEKRAVGGDGIWQYPSRRMSVMITLCNVFLLFLGMAALIVFAVAWMRVGS